ncbi:hypothetical protein FACS1894199_08550 [Bacteroidia bacterium]|nr:hypothetical protein FACS1894199_08550 [Bacteroidia bacterium]
MAGVVIPSCSDDDKGPTTVAVTGITLNETTLTLAIGATETLTAAVLPEDATDKTVTWSSSTPATATVSSSGVVTAVAAGTTTITATAGDNKTATCVVTVNPAPVELITFNLKGELKKLEVGTGVNPQKVVVYDNPEFTGTPLGAGTIGGTSASPSSVRPKTRAIGEVQGYENENGTQWEIPLNNIDPNECPQLYFAVTGLNPGNAPFMYPLNDFAVPVTGITNDGDYDINARLQNNNPFNDGIEIECIMIEGTLKVTGINSGDWPDGDWGDLVNFASGWLMVYDANGAEIGSFLLNDYPHPESEVWTQEAIDGYGDYWTDNPEVTKPSAGDVIRPKDIVYFHGMIPARPSTLHFDLGFGDDKTGKTRANVTSFIPFNLTADKITVDDLGMLNSIDGIDLGTGDITGVTIPAPVRGGPEE